MSLLAGENGNLEAYEAPSHIVLIFALDRCSLPIVKGPTKHLFCRLFFVHHSGEDSTQFAGGTRKSHSLAAVRLAPRNDPPRRFVRRLSGSRNTSARNASFSRSDLVAIATIAAIVEPPQECIGPHRGTGRPNQFPPDEGSWDGRCSACHHVQPSALVVFVAIRAVSPAVCLSLRRLKPLTRQCLVFRLAGTPLHGNRECRETALTNPARLPASESPPANGNHRRRRARGSPRTRHRSPGQ